MRKLTSFVNMNVQICDEPEFERSSLLMIPKTTPQDLSTPQKRYCGVDFF